MYSYHKKMLAVAIALVFLFGSITAVHAQPSDITGHWAEKVMKKWIDYGVVQGFEGNYKPNENISRAEFVVFVNRTLMPLTKSANIFSDVVDKQWFAEDVLKAVNAGYIQGDGKGSFKPAADITRQEAAVVLYKAFDMKPGDHSAMIFFKDYSQVADWAKDAVAALVQNGFMAGKSGSRLAPSDKITRAETINLINNIAGELKNKAGTYTGSVEGSLVINTPGVVLKDMTIKGNLHIAQGVGQGDVDLDNVTVMGKTIVKGGGENSIRIKNSNLNGTLYVIKKDGNVRIVLVENTSVANVEIGGSVKLAQENLTGEGFGGVTIIPMAKDSEIVIQGDINELTIEAPNTEVKVLDGTVTRLTVADSAHNTAVEIAKEATVKTLTAEAKLDVTGKGTIEKAVINAPEVKIEQKPATVEVEKGVEANIGGRVVTETPATPVTPPTGGGGGTGGGDDSEKKYAAISSALLKVSSGDAAATANIVGKDYTVDIKGKDSADTISGISIGAPAGSTLQVTKVSWPGGAVEGNFNPISLGSSTTTVSVTSLLGDPNNPMPEIERTQVKVGTMRTIFGKQVVVDGTLSCSGYKSQSVKLTIILSE